MATTHPKNFISLDDAGQLPAHRADADHAATLIAA